MKSDPDVPVQPEPRTVDEAQELYSRETREFLSKLKGDYNLYEQFTRRERSRSVALILSILLFASVFVGFSTYQAHYQALNQQALLEIHQAVTQAQSAQSKASVERFNALVNNEHLICIKLGITSCQ